MKRPPKKKRPQQGERKKWTRIEKLMLYSLLIELFFKILENFI